MLLNLEKLMWQNKLRIFKMDSRYTIIFSVKIKNNDAVNLVYYEIGS